MPTDDFLLWDNFWLCSTCMRRASKNKQVRFRKNTIKHARIMQSNTAIHDSLNAFEIRPQMYILSIEFVIELALCYGWCCVYMSRSGVFLCGCLCIWCRNGASHILVTWSDGGARLFFVLVLLVNDSHACRLKITT